MHWIPVNFYVFIICTTTFVGCDTWSNQLPEVERYEIVKPRKLDIVLRKRALSSSEIVYPEKVSYSLNLEGNETIVHLEKNKGLLGKWYSETRYTENGTEVTETPQLKDHCYYHGIIDGVNDSSVSMSTCSGLRGVLMAGARVYLIEPLEGAEAGEHALYREEHLRVKRGTCGTSNYTIYDNEPKVAAIYQTFGQRLPQDFRNTKYVELYLVVDNAEYQKYDRDFLKVRKRMIEIVNHVDQLYRTLNARIALVGLEVWSQSDKFTVSTNPDVTLDRFLIWRENLKKKHDNAQFVTGKNFDGSTVGLATKHSMCGYHSAGVNEDHSKNAIGLASTIAHEMGHNFGMLHDEDHGLRCKCYKSKQEGGCVMDGQTGTIFPKVFSSCSSEDMKNFLISRRPNCLLNAPGVDRLYESPACGNRFLDPGEQCDCGTAEECTNPCCNFTTCRFNDGMECSDGECCQNCKIKPLGQLCRAARHDCDLNEYCDGVNTQCPEDVFRMNGFPCKNGEGYCYKGRCPTHKQHCVDLWGKGTMVAEDVCFELNRNGNAHFHCRKTARGFVACQEKDMKCGKMHCTGGSQKMNLRRFTQWLNNRKSCVVAEIMLQSKETTDVSLVPMGTKCGDEMVCYNSQCQSLLLYGSPNCSAKCHNRGVCNHKAECHCDPGWAPPYCDTQTKYSTSGGISALVIVVSVILPLIILAILITIALLYYKKSQKQEYIKKTQMKPSLSSGLSNPLFAEGKDRTNFKVAYASNRNPNVKHSMTTVPKPFVFTEIPAVNPSRQAPKPPSSPETFIATDAAKPLQIVKPSAPPPPPPSSKPITYQAVAERVPPARPPPPPTKPLPHLKEKQVVKPNAIPVPAVKPVFPTAPAKQPQVGFRPKVALMPPIQRR
uniref:Disintegrin and metalloproteinase domain-containing protein 8 n=2 Tax=Callorhinchus milii TaxID=7868 RepID=A0A4W3I0H1_CALMI